MARGTKSQLDLGDRITGAILALLFAVPTVALCWVVLNYELAFVWHFFSSTYFWATAGIAVMVGFVFPNALINLLGGLWRFLHRLAKLWWS